MSNTLLRISSISGDTKWISSKVLASYGVSFLIVGIFVLLIAFVLQWYPRSLKQEFVMFNGERQGSLELTPYVKHELAETRKVPNFLPETHEIFANDDSSDYLNFFATNLKKRAVHRNHGTEVEAETSLRLARQMCRVGKYDKARKLLEHALILNPAEPDILTEYGEFLEQHASDLIKADHMYTRALVLEPDHSQALVNRKRTLPIVERLDEKQLERIDSKRNILIRIPDGDPALKRMKKEAYFQHIHHTVAIEGNTMSLAETRHVVETRAAVAGKSILEHNEIIGLEAALRFVNTTLINKRNLDVNDVLQMHKRILGHVTPLEAGSFRNHAVFVGEHQPPKASLIPDLMNDFLEWLNSPDVLQLHPVKYAAIAHYKFVFIHPFADGNGRTARLLMNLLLMRVGYPPVIIRKQDRAKYYEYLQTANEGDVRPFVRFIGECTELTLDYYLFAVTSNNPEEGGDALESPHRSLLMDHGYGEDDDESLLRPLTNIAESSDQREMRRSSNGRCSDHQSTTLATLDGQHDDESQDMMDVQTPVRQRRLPPSTLNHSNWEPIRRPRRQSDPLG